MSSFILSLSTEVVNPFTQSAVEKAVGILKRDMQSVLLSKDGAKNSIRLEKDASLSDEEFVIDVQSSLMTVFAGGSLGFVYGLLRISRDYLGIKPFWFWLDQELPTLDFAEIPLGTLRFEKPAVRFRGWFLNDEVLMMSWDTGRGHDFPWRMAFEALLRCGGNMVITGTDKYSRLYRRLAHEHGLWLTHHHAEPLGAEIFARAHPDLPASYADHPDEFIALWEEAIEKYSDTNTVWTLGFRGQGDCPFWEGMAPGLYDTAQKQGELISDLIEKQRQMVLSRVKNPVFCTNLYGEVMELYNEGHIRLHPDIIKVWADNGYGKMVTRRRDNHCVRVVSLPKENDGGKHGVYYHASFHDLQAAGHIAPLPNTVSFVNSELQNAMSLGVTDYWIINCSNIRPHAYYLDAIRKLWQGESVSDERHSAGFSKEYYQGSAAAENGLRDYASALIRYGQHEDQNAGEQFYNYAVRALARQFVTDKAAGSKSLLWLTGDIGLFQQAKRVLEINAGGFERLKVYYDSCKKASLGLSGSTKRLYDSTVLLHAKIHHLCNIGAIQFCTAFEKLEKNAYMKGFYLLGRAAESFEKANSAMRQAEYGIWKGFYENDCLTDIKFTAYIIRGMMRAVRIMGDDHRYALWYEDLFRSKRDRKVRLLSITKNHMSDEALFAAMKERPDLLG